ncbi:hypothetical protein PC121_g1970 [Phytophthora cactorum]|nr:hypothetical protein PC121_g1970 [Phytophthora cactorum]
MRTSGGAGASLRRLRDAPPGHLHPLPIWLLILLLLCSLVAAEPASQPAQQRREWSPQIPLESQVTVGADGIATSRGAGRRRSDGLSITRSIPVDTGIAPDAAVDDQAIKFTPARVDLGRVETCSPQRYYVGVENRGRVSVRLDGADFTHEGFSLANDVRGIRLDPGDRFNVQFVFLPSEEEPKGVDAHLRVLTTSGLFSLPISSSEVVTNRYGVRAIRASVPVGVRFGQSLQFINPLNYTIRITEVYALDSFVHIDLLNGSNWIGSRWPREDDDKEAQEVPGEYDPQFDYIRRADRGAWDMPAGTTSPLIKVSLQKNMPAGVYFTFIHIAADKLRLLMVPVRITVLKPGIHIEPKELDLGMLTDLHDDVHREVSFTLYNTGLNPIEILELKVLESNLIVSAELWGRSSVIPPRTQVSNALAIQIRVDKEITGNCFASLMLKTNASSSELGQRRLKFFVLQPGYQVEFSVNVMAQDILGELTVPVITVETPIEIFHLYVRLRSVQGTIEPVTPAIVLPSMFPGRTQVIHIHYRNTFEHAVTPLMATISSSNLKILSMRDAIAPKRVESVLDVLFSPAESSKCSDAVFLVDCLIPLPDTVHEQACEQLSDYGEFVDKRDLEALRRRDAFWGKMQESDHQSTVEAQVHLQTDIMEDVAEVTIKALLERPVVTASLHLSNNASRMIERTEFELTELLDRSYVFINVRNPSNISIQMELTIAETDQTLFYSCSEELNEDERSDHNRNGDTEDNSEGISALCLAEWKAATADAVALQRDRHVDIYVPPFYVQRRIIQVSAGEEAQLGPIYYLPSKVQEVATTVFVRNDLSHIEPVQLLARSGKGTLDLLVDTPADSSKPRFDEENIAEDCALFGCNGILHFSLTHDDALTDYTQDAGFLLSNTGPFGLVVRTMNVEPPSWTSDAASRMSDFLVTLEEFPGQNDKNGKVVLSPGTTARFRVSFRASCFAARVASWLIIDTSDTIKRIQLQGTITTDAAFSCLRSRMAPPLRNACLYAWIIAAMVTVITMLYTVLLLVYDAWTHEAVPHVQLFNLAAKTDSTSTEMATNEDITFSNMEGEGKLPPLKLVSFNRLLEDMEQTAFTPSARVVTPAVSHLLEQRRKGLHSSVRTGNVHVNEEPSFSLRDVQEEAENESGASNLSASAPQNVFSVIKLLEDINDRKRSELSSDERSSESPASSSHSSIVQPDAEESSRDAHFPQLSFGSLDDQRKLGTGSALHAAIDTNSTKTAEEAFEAFKSLSTRWRSEDWQNNLNEPPSPSLSGNFSDWNGTLSLNTLGNGLLGSTDTGNQRDETVRSGNRSESSSFIGAAPRLYLNEFAAFDAPGARLSTGTTPKSTSKKAPPGFTPADAKPLEARAAFERLRSRTTPSVPTVSSSNDGFGGNSVFASKLPLFGPALPPTNDDRVMLGSVGRIGSGRLKGLHGLDAPTK